MSARLIASGAFFLFWAMGAHAQAVPDVAPIRHTVAMFADAWNRHDMKAFGQLFAPDADFVNVQGVWWKGRAEIELHHAYSHGTISKSEAATLNPQLRHYGMFRHSTMAFQSITVRLIRPDLAIAHVSWRLTGDSRTTVARTGMLTFVLAPTNGRWLIVAAQNTEIHRVVH